MTEFQNHAILTQTNPAADAPAEKEDHEMSGAKITALYCRLSQEDERLGESLSIEHQKEILLRYAREHRFPNPTFFVDDGWSGTDFNRPGFQKLLAEIEAGHVGVLLTKDLSRLGRNSAMVGLFTTYTFPQSGVRYIAINDGFDTADQMSVSQDFAGIRNWFNEFFARDTSRKIRAIYRAKGERGIHLSVNAPYGYVKDPGDPKRWLVDPEAAEVVRRIFDLCMEGRGPHQIARQLTEERVLAPTAYKQQQGQNTPGPTPENPYFWSDGTVARILERREYTGCTVNFRTYRASLWDKKQRMNPEEKTLVFPDTHEAIVDEAVFQRVQEIRRRRHRVTKTGIISIFSGLMYCPDCGAPMRYSATGGRGRTDQAFFECGTHANKRRQEKCGTHFIRESALKPLVLKHIQAVTGCILFHEEYFRRVIRQQQEVRSEKQLRALQARQERSEKRIAELKRLFVKIYEDNAAGRLSDERYELLSASYEAEQKQLEAEVSDLQSQIQSQEAQAAQLEKFIQTVKKYSPAMRESEQPGMAMSPEDRRYADASSHTVHEGKGLAITELDSRLVHELIERIEVFAPDKSSGRRTQRIHIRYAGLGFIPAQALTQAKE